MSRHPWEELIEFESHRQLLWQSKSQLEIAWKRDKMFGNQYPINTHHVIAELKRKLSKRRPGGQVWRMLIHKAPNRLAELVPEKLIKSVWQNQHEGSFLSAIRRAADGGTVNDPKQGWKAFQEIIRAVETAYLVGQLGFEFLPRPKVSILHRGLDQVERTADLGLTEEGFAGFLDDLCPCGRRNHGGAVRKLSSRSKAMQRPRT
jgi:hypothetical protein